MSLSRFRFNGGVIGCKVVLYMYVPNGGDTNGVASLSLSGFCFKGGVSMFVMSIVVVSESGCVESVSESTSM